MKNIPIGEVLKEYGYITDENIQEALRYQKTDEGKDTRLGDALLVLGFVTEKQVLEALGKKLSLPLLDFKDYPVDIEAVAKVQKNLAIQYKLIPVSQKNGHLQVAMSDPLNFYAREDIRQLVGMSLDIYLCVWDEIEKAIESYYPEVNARIATEQAKVAAAQVELDIPKPEEDEDEDAPVIKLINSLLARGYSINASDIHIEPFESQTTIRMRVDGMIVDYATIAKSLHSSLVARVKIMANLDIAERRIPQDGNFRVKIENFDISVRVSVIPTIHGEKVVMRYLSSDVTIDNSGTFGMNRESYTKLSEMLNAPNGIIYITGPTGSGKTTTLYMVLEELAKRQVNICTIENPVERNMAKINQMNVNNAAGLSFSIGLRALLRQDPDIIMLGETRDTETAEISIRAAITGHLVLSTLHTNDAISSIVRLEDMGIAPYMVANSLIGIVAQRLVRKVCPNCSYDVETTEEERAILGKDIRTVKKGRGCHNCNNTGYKGRISIHEIVHIDKTLKRMITKGEDTDKMYEYAVKVQGMRNLREQALDLVERGITTPEEVTRVAYYSD